MPDLVGEATAEESPRLFGPGIFTVEESPGSNALALPAHRELLVRGYGFVWVIIESAERLKDILSRGISRLRYSNASSFRSELR